LTALRSRCQRIIFLGSGALLFRSLGIIYLGRQCLQVIRPDFHLVAIQGVLEKLPVLIHDPNIVISVPARIE
jgi:hypothetical protein